MLSSTRGLATKRGSCIPESGAFSKQCRSAKYELDRRMLNRRGRLVIVTRCKGAEESMPKRSESRPAWRKKYKQLLPFDEVRRMAQGMGLRNKDDWDEWVNEGKKSPWFGPYMPSEPDLVYEDEWQGWDDFLGIPLPFKEARKIARSLDLKSQEEWWAYASGGGAGGVKAAADKAAAAGKGASAVYRAASKAAHRLKSLQEERKHPNLPAKPHIYYRNEWKGYDDWLGLEEQILTAPKEWGQENPGSKDSA